MTEPAPKPSLTAGQKALPFAVAVGMCLGAVVVLYNWDTSSDLGAVQYFLTTCFCWGVPAFFAIRWLFNNIKFSNQPPT